MTGPDDGDANTNPNRPTSDPGTRPDGWPDDWWPDDATWNFPVHVGDGADF